MNKNTFVYNTEWYVILADFPKEVRTEVYEAINIYAMSGVVVELEPVAKMAFAFIRRELDYNNEKYAETVEKRRAAGKRSAEKRQARKALAAGPETTGDSSLAVAVRSEVSAEEPRPQNYDAAGVTSEAVGEEPADSSVWSEALEDDNSLKNSGQGDSPKPVASTMTPQQAPAPATATDIIPTAELNARLAKEFEKFRQAYPGNKRGADVEFEYFRKRHPHRWQAIVPRLMPAVERLIAYHTAAEEARRKDPTVFVPNYPYLSTWINGARWDDEYPKIRMSGASVNPAPKRVPAVEPIDFGGRVY